jgi:hypothetical protein
MSGGELFFALSGVALAIVPWALSALGVELSRRTALILMIVGCASLVGAITIPLAIFAYERWFAPPTYVYLLPGRGLGENSAQAPHELIPRRVFVLQQVGPGILHNVELTLQDNHAEGQTSAAHVENWQEVDPGESDLHNVQPKHFWFKPSTPWSEGYTIAIRSREKSFLERILVLGVAPVAPPGTPLNPPPAPKVTPRGDGPLEPEMGKVEFAIRVTENGSKDPLFTCRDPDLEQQPEWQADPSRPCSQHSSDILSFEAGLDPKPFVLVFPSGMIDMSPNLPSQLSSHPETEPSIRELSGWQKGQMEEQLVKSVGNKILILVVGDSATWRYARDFRDVFLRSHWKVRGPMAGPRTSCTRTDVELWTWKNDLANTRPQVIAARKALEAAGVKGGHFHECVLEGPNALVLWVGAKSPDEIKDDFPTCLPEASSEVDKLAAHF